MCRGRSLSSFDACLFCTTLRRVGARTLEQFIDRRMHIEIITEITFFFEQSLGKTRMSATFLILMALQGAGNGQAVA